MSAPAHKPAQPLACGAGFKGRSAGKIAAAANVMAAEVLQQLDAPQLVEFFRIHSPNLAAFEIAAPMLPAVMAAILTGATTCGPQGYQDRMTLFRMLGARQRPQPRSAAAGHDDRLNQGTRHDAVGPE